MDGVEKHQKNKKLKIKELENIETILYLPENEVNLKEDFFMKLRKLFRLAEPFEMRHLRPR